MTQQPPAGEGGRVTPADATYTSPYATPRPTSADSSTPDDADHPASTSTSPGPEAYAELRSPPPGYGVPEWKRQTPAPRVAPPKPLDKLAIVTAVVGVLGGVGISLVLGIVTLLRIRKSGNRGTPLAILGIVLGLVWTGAIGVGVIALRDLGPTRAADGTVTEAGRISVTDLRKGDCVEEWATAGTMDRITVVPCTAAHTAEVFHTFTLAAGAFPGDADITKQANTQCQAAAKTSIKPADTAAVRVAFVKPLEATWATGDRTVDCAAVSTSGPLTHSVRP